MRKEVMETSERGDPMVHRARGVKCSPAPPLNAKPGALEAVGGAEPGRSSPTRDLAANEAVPAAP